MQEVYYCNINYIKWSVPMRIKKLVFLSAVLFSTLPLFAHAADIHLTNLTNSYGTGSINGHCSTEAGQGGVAEPGKSITIPQAIVFLFCGFFDCDGHLYATQDCSGKRIGTLRINLSRGVTSISNVDADYVINGGGENVVIKPATGFRAWLKSLI
jgi:hypothetical protein